MRAVTLLETLISVAIVAVAAGTALPLLGAARTISGLSTSFGNLAVQGAGHVMYAADWNGRQLTLIAEDVSAYGGDDAAEGFFGYMLSNGDHPDVILGWGCREWGGETGCGLWAYLIDQGSPSPNYCLPQPIPFTGPCSRRYGSFRLYNARPFHAYAGSGGFYDPVFYAPRDTAAWAIVKPAFQRAVEYQFLDGLDASGGEYPAWSSYCLSPASMFHPDVMRSPRAGGWQDPWSIDHGFASPGFFQAEHPTLKTHMLEHHWNQNRPEEFCDPAVATGTFSGCEPYYFNHGLASEPATLFYDLSVRTLPNRETIAADEMIQKATGVGLWSRDTPWGEDGYFSERSLDGTRTSHHVLTTDGILGRDTIANP